MAVESCCSSNFKINILHCTEYLTYFPLVGHLHYFRDRMESSYWITKTKAERILQKNTIQVTDMGIANFQNSVQYEKVCVTHDFTPSHVILLSRLTYKTYCSL